MISFRVLNNLIRFPTQVYRRTKTSLTRQDVDFIKNPDEKYISAFMKWHGDSRSNFKRNDFQLWRDAFGDDFWLKLICLKGTTRVIGSAQGIRFRPLANNKNEIPFVFLGMGWIDEEIRGPDAAQLLNDVVAEEITTPVEIEQTTSQLNVNSRVFWQRLMNKESLKNKEVGHHSIEAHYISFYDYDEMQIPDGLDLERYTVKNSVDVPEEDIIKYDNKVYKFERSKYIMSHLNDPDGFGKVVYDNNTGKVVGFGQCVVYPSGECCPGPIYADNHEAVQAMFMEVLKDMKEKKTDVKRFNIRSNQQCSKSFHWLQPFVKRKITRDFYCNLVYGTHPPKGIDYDKVYVDTHAQVCYS